MAKIKIAGFILLIAIAQAGLLMTAVAGDDWDRPFFPGDQRPETRARTTAPAPAGVRRDTATRQGRRARPVPSTIYSVILDAPTEPMFSYRLSMVEGTRADDHGRTGIFELDADHELAFFLDALRGDIELGLSLHTTVFTRNFSDNYPRYWTRMNFDVAWLWRYLNGVSLELTAAPGIYGDFNAPARELAHVPFGLRLHQVFHPDLAGVIGFSVRPGWQLPVVPSGGIVWEPMPSLRCEFMVPRSRINMTLRRLSLFGNGEWSNWSYAAGTDDRSAKQFTSSDLSLGLGAGWRFSDELEMTLEYGRVLERRIKTDASGYRTLHLENANYWRIGLTGPF